MKATAVLPIEILGFRKLVRGERCDVPEGREKEFERLERRGLVKIERPAPVPAASLPSPTKQVEHVEEDSEPRAPAPEPPTRPERPAIPCMLCGKTFVEHAKKRSERAPGDDKLACGGLRNGYRPKKP